MGSYHCTCLPTVGGCVGWNRWLDYLQENIQFLHSQEGAKEG